MTAAGIWAALAALAVLPVLVSGATLMACLASSLRRGRPWARDLHPHRAHAELLHRRTS